MNDVWNNAMSIINNMLSLCSAVSTFLLIMSLVTFAVEPLNWVYSVISGATQDNVSDKVFFAKHCIRLMAVIMVFMVLRITPMAEWLIVLLRKGLGV